MTQQQLVEKLEECINGNKQTTIVAMRMNKAFCDKPSPSKGRNRNSKTTACRKPLASQ